MLFFAEKVQGDYKSYETRVEHLSYWYDHGVFMTAEILANIYGR